MSSARWSLVEAAALLLEPGEREAVLGDLAETGVNAWRAVLGVLGLIVRRQVTAWREWQPWLAAFGLAMPGSFFLMGASISVSAGVAAWFYGGALTPTRSAQLFCELVLLVAWSWTGGFVVGSISRRTLWVSASLCASPCLLCLSEFRSQTLSRPCLVVFLVPAIVGVLMGIRIRRIPFPIAMTLAVIVTSFLLPTLTSQPGWMTAWAVVWPAWYLVVVAKRAKLAEARAQ
jgi:hypothetical protein